MLFIITISIILLIHILVLLGLINALVAIGSEDMDYLFPFVMVAYAGGSCLGQFAPLFFLFQYSFLFYRRGVYGEKHSRATLYAFLSGILGMILPVFLGLMLIMFIEIFDKIYIVIPLLIHSIPVFMMLGAYFFVKDIGGKEKAGMGFVLFAISSFFGALTEMIVIYDPIKVPDSTWTLISIIGIFLALGAIAGLVLIIMGFNDAGKWTNKHKPLIDTEQKKQMEMQQNQIKIQMEQLELQYKQLELQKQSMEMLAEIRQETIEGGNIMIPEEVDTFEKEDNR